MLPHCSKFSMLLLSLRTNAEVINTYDSGWSDLFWPASHFYLCPPSLPLWSFIFMVRTYCYLTYCEFSCLCLSPTIGMEASWGQRLFLFTDRASASRTLPSRQQGCSYLWITNGCHCFLYGLRLALPFCSFIKYLVILCTLHSGDRIWRKTPESFQSNMGEQLINKYI